MSTQLLMSYTVVGVLNGAFNVRVHQVVQASSPDEALRFAVQEIPTRYAHSSPGSTEFLAYAVFEGRPRCAHRGLINGPWGEDRSGRVAQAGEVSPLTVVAVDPATRALVVVPDDWLAPGNAERDVRFDFYLIASVLEGHRYPLLASAPGSPTTRNERVLAMLRYSPEFARFFGTTAPMHMPA